jgi:RNA polymerase sigma-54 factor
MIPSMTLGLGLQAGCSAETAMFAHLLALPITDLEEVVSKEVEENPFLEQGTPPCRGCGSVLCGGCEATWRGARLPPSGTGGGADFAGCIDPRHLVAQRARAELPAHLSAAVVVIIEHCDDRGILSKPSTVIAQDFRLDRPTLDAAIRWIRNDVGPSAAADNLTHSLRLQLRRLQPSATVELADELLRHHQRAVADGRLGDVVHAVREPVEHVTRAIELIRTELTLAPATFDDDAEPPPRPAPPDVVVTIDPASGAPVVTLAEERLQLRLSPELVQAVRRQPCPQLERRLSAARSFLRRMGRRMSTLRAVSELAVARQRALILNRPDRADAPLTRAEVSALLSLHQSTVSRAVSGRTLRRPDETVIEMSDLFDRSLAPKAAIERLITAESRALSDAQLAQVLARHGMELSRRTVAKYRLELGIPNSTERSTKSAADRQ